MTVDAVTKPAADRPVATSRIASRCCAGRIRVSGRPPWSVGV
jgi:hypothetical protein